MAGELDPSLLTSQYLLARVPGVVPDGWRRQALGEWVLVTAPDLPALPLADEVGKPLGWVVGHPVDPDAGAIVAGTIRLSFAATSATDLMRALDEELHRLGGRWAALVVQPRPLALPDGYGSLPVLYAPALETVTSSPFLLARSEALPADSELVDVMRVYETGLTFGLGTTPLAGVELLAPNHGLDLRTWTAARVWPREPLEPIGLAEAVERVAASFEATIAAAVRLGNAHDGLTAGGDTRMIVACARAHVDRIDFFTVPFPDLTGRTDARWAPRIARQFGLSHRVLPWQPPGSDEVKRFMYRTGCLVGERRGRLAGPTYALLGADGPYVSGVNGCIARGADWKRGDRADTVIPARDLPRRLYLPEHPELVRRAETWHASRPAMHKLDMLTLLQIEGFDTAWGGQIAGAYVDAATVTLYPYGNRDVIEAFLRVPWADRWDDRVRRGVIASRWPELLELPFNQPSLRVAAEHRGRRWAGRARAAVRKAGRALSPGR